MSLFYPTLRLERITGLTQKQLADWGVKALLLDVDNTLTTHNNPLPDQAVRAWLDRMRAGGIKLVILSNNHRERVEPFAKHLGMDYTARAGKPLTFGLRRTAERLGLHPDQLAMVGDQIFTDILGGNLFGCKTVLVDLMEPETGPFFRLKRRLEKGVLARYDKMHTERGDK